MKFIIAVNESDTEEGNGSVTFDVVETDSNNPRTNKRKLKEYLTERGVPNKEHKKVLKALGFWGSALGSNHETTKS